MPEGPCAERVFRVSAPRPLETDYLAPAERALRLASATLPGDSFEARLQLLEACAARFGGFDLAQFDGVFGITPIAAPGKLIELASIIVLAIERSPIHPALALSALSREALQESDRKRTGAYHTDFRLARRLAELAAGRLSYRSKAIDPACGAGILLAALTVAVCGMDRAKVAAWLADGIFAADRSANSLRATLLALASMTDDLVALKKMRTRWLCGDSLLAEPKVWSEMAPGGFDAVIGNPPWEKVKLSRHEFLRASGAARHYGADTEGLDEDRFNEQRSDVADYSRRLLARYPDLASGEPDLYVAFTALSFELCRPGGTVALLVPGGLIRSQGTQRVRRRLFDSSQSISLSVIDNRARFFAIDSRFKFLAIALVKVSGARVRREPISLLHERGTTAGMETFGAATIGRSVLGEIRGDLSLPEVRSQAEWRVFLKVSAASCRWDDPAAGWRPHFCREVDMTKERPKFLAAPTKTALPLVEGRMVHQHRFGVKGYFNGSGRKAIWTAFPIGQSRLTPQFWIEPPHVPAGSRSRAESSRLGFCDIAGQTNERSLMAALIPRRVFCGNKVPTILFPEDPSVERLLVWAAIANSFVFDWMLRRVLTTTVNYFLLQSIGLPKLTKGGLPWQRLATSAAALAELDVAGANLASHRRMEQLRAEIDAEVAVAYGLRLKDVELILRDFPILDRGQPSLPNEAVSTITIDTVLAAVAGRVTSRSNPWHQRAQQARDLGARAYVPSEIAGEGRSLAEDSGVTNG